MRRHARIPAGLLDDVPPGPVKVLLAIAAHLNVHTSTAHLTLDRLAAETGYSRSQLQRNLRALEDAGVLVITRGRGRGRASSYHCPWHLFTVRRPALFTPVEDPEKGSSVTPFSGEKGVTDASEKVSSMTPPIKTTDKENTPPRGDPRACTHGIRWGDRLDSRGISTGGCYRCEKEAAFHARAQ